MKKNIDLIFVLTVSLILLSGLVKTIAAPISINEYENRKAYQLTAPTAETFADGTFQQDCDNAFSDQIFGAIAMKERYNQLFSDYSEKVFALIIEGSKETEEAPNPAEEPAGEDLAGVENPKLSDQDAETSLDAPSAPLEEVPDEPEDPEEDPGSLVICDQRIFTMGDGKQILGDHVMYPPRFLKGEKANIDVRIAGINKLIEKYPQLEIYAYYIEKETDANFATGEKSGIYEYLQEKLNLDASHFAGFRIWDFESFDRMFYRSDHHWNYLGSYAGYRSMLKLLKPGEKPLEPFGEPVLLGSLKGSKATGSCSNYRDDVYVYPWELPEYKVTINKEEAEDYGGWASYLKQKEEGTELGFLNYALVYGEDAGELILENPQSEGGSILIFGESYDNAVLKLLANHFHTIYSVDLRNYKAKIGTSFDLQDYLSQHPDIETVFLVGNLDYYVLSLFNVK